MIIFELDHSCTTGFYGGKANTSRVHAPIHIPVLVRAKRRYRMVPHVSLDLLWVDGPFSDSKCSLFVFQFSFLPNLYH